MYNKGQKVLINFYNSKQEGIVQRKRGRYAYDVTYLTHWTTQDFATGKIITHKDYVTKSIPSKLLSEV